MTSFAKDIKPLFREKDVAAMTFMLNLHDYEDVKENADDVLEAVQAGSMPCDESWPADRVDVFRTWMSEDFPE
jgi:hypothetical protein